MRPKQAVQERDAPEPQSAKREGAGDRIVRLMAGLTHGAQVAIYHADATGRRTYANVHFRELFKLKATQPLDLWEEQVHPVDRPGVQEAWEEFRRSPAPFKCQWRSLSPTGELRHYHESVTRLNVAGVGGYVGTITDITDLRAAQAETKELHQRLKDTGQFGGEALEALRRTAHVAAELREAMEGNHLELFYQPKVELATNQLVGAEALIRWRHPLRGLIQPAAFIPIAEESGLIGPMGEWIFRETCRQLRVWQDAGLLPIRVAVNLSPFQFRQGNLVAMIREALTEHSLEARYLEVELTESTVMNDAAGSAVILERLSQMGITISLDDFGTGYSNLSYLRRFPVDKLKIDRTFIAEILSRPEDASIVQAIVSLAHGLRLKVIAEGVESAAQLEVLKSMGCDQYQGYFFSHPLPAAEFACHLEDCGGDESIMDRAGARTHSKLFFHGR